MLSRSRENWERWLQRKGDSYQAAALLARCQLPPDQLGSQGVSGLVYPARISLKKGWLPGQGLPGKREWVFFKEWTPRRIIVVVCQGEGLHQACQQTEAAFGHLSFAGNHGLLNFSTSRGDLWGDRGLSFSSSPCPSTADKLEPKRGKDGTALHRPCKGVTSTRQFRPPVLLLIGDKTLCPENEIRLKPADF